MTFGPDKVVACPSCKAPMRERTWLSGNTRGMQVYSDGYREMRMMYVPPRVGLCPRCHRYFWVGKCRELGYLKSGWIEDPKPVDPPEWLAAPQIEQLEPEQLLEAIAQGLPRNRNAEMNLRIEAWWGHNHHLRNTTVPESPSASRPGSFTANLERMLNLMRKDRKAMRSADGRLMFAEVLRQLGRYSEALEHYGSVGPDCIPSALDALKQACRDKNPWPINITPFLQ